MRDVCAADVKNFRDRCGERACWIPLHVAHTVLNCAHDLDEAYGLARAFCEGASPTDLRLDALERRLRELEGALRDAGIPAPEDKPVPHDKLATSDK